MYVVRRFAPIAGAIMFGALCACSGVRLALAFCVTRPFPPLFVGVWGSCSRHVALDVLLPSTYKKNVISMSCVFKRRSFLAGGRD